MSGNNWDKWDAQDLIQWQEARRWLAKADEDLVAAQRLLPEMVNQAAFHVQQATEKTLKALMVAKRQEIRKTHDISLLVSLVRPFWPDLIPQRIPTAELSEWYVVSRYPGLDEVALTISDVATALASVTDFLKVVRGCGPQESIQGG
jgi:HEPN domain-containing protein